MRARHESMNKHGFKYMACIEMEIKTAYFMRKRSHFTTKKDTENN
jgi:hypothetical protein